ncbi:MAG: 2-oxoacid:acceptor oxidoreductase family protein [Rhodospirillaceae bacterium]|nr:2-oxoacid:acceptor oxidoreductase family protein [Rhodospirillaceae bacterium]
MFRIRFHGRGGQGMKTASRVLGTAFFRAGYTVQDAPRYGAERRGAPVFAYVRADTGPIHERGDILHPDLVVVADETLVGVPAAGVLLGLDAESLLLIDTAESDATWRARLALAGPVLALPKPGDGTAEDFRYVGAACAGAAARLVGVIPRECLIEAVADEYAAFGAAMAARNREIALAAYDAMAPHEGRVKGRHDMAAAPAPNWIDPPLEFADISAPAIHAPMTSVEVRTGLWRSMRPVIDYDRCRRCWWVCSTFCPDSAIAVKEGRPVIDYDHCKGCMICVAQCPPHAIAAVPESRAAEETKP